MTTLRPYQTSFIERLRAAMPHRRVLSYGWSQQRIADHMSISRTTVRRELATA